MELGECYQTRNSNFKTGEGYGEENRAQITLAESHDNGPSCGLGAERRRIMGGLDIAIHGKLPGSRVWLLGLEAGTRVIYLPA
jgi:hypothetical protein